MSARKQPAAQDRRWRNQVVHEQDHHRSRVLWRTLLCMVVALTPGGAWLVQQSECLQIAYELTDLRAEYGRLIEEERRLSIEKARLESLAGVEAWAKRQGLVREPERVVVLKSQQPDDRGDLLARAD